MKDKNIGYIINSLRQASIMWPTRHEVLNRGRRLRKIGVLKDGRDKTIWENYCEKCGEWHDQKDNMFEVDHIEEVGPYKGDLHEFALRIFCDIKNLQRLCLSCHKAKTAFFNSTARFKRKEDHSKRKLDAL